MTGSFTGALPVIAVILVLAMLLPIFTRNPASTESRWAHLAPRRRVQAWRPRGFRARGVSVRVLF